MARKKASTKGSVLMYSIVDKKKVRVENPKPEVFVDSRGVRRYRLAGQHNGRKIVKLVSKDEAMSYGKPATVRPKTGARKRLSCKAKYEKCEAKKASRKKKSTKSKAKKAKATKAKKAKATKAKKAKATKAKKAKATKAKKAKAAKAKK